MPAPGSGAPLFFFNATDLRTNTGWFFTRDPGLGPLARNYRLGRYRQDFLLSDVVAASAAFPPFFAPMELDLVEAMPREDDTAPGGWLEKVRERNPELAEAFDRRALLGDGGIYDNLGLERAEHFRHVMISNAGDPFGTDRSIRRNWWS
ncbi:hypothetical protein [Parvularcula maris]|uniref:hypothetical protein n=1 Tax=Parvularcula maris TaxID=2965077 RepID=UPI00351A8DC8